MAQQSYEVDAVTYTVQPPSGLYNPNASSIVPSGTGTSALTNYSVTSQNLQFSFFRQNLIIPNGSYFDPNLTYQVGTSSYYYPCAGGWTVANPYATNNRIMVQGQASYQVQLIPTTIFNVSSARVPQTFQALGAASGVSGNGLYGSGTGSVTTLQPGYLRLPTTSSTSSINYVVTKTFVFPLYLRVGSWESIWFPGTNLYDPVNQIITDVANKIKSDYIPEFRTDLLFV